MNNKLILLSVFFAVLIMPGCKKASPFVPASAEAVTYAELVSVPGGAYTQSDPYGNSFTHTITAFKIGKHEVTYKLWYKVYQWAESNGYSFAHAGLEGNDGTAGAAPSAEKHEPATTMNWRDAIVWCNAYSQMSGITPVYYSDAGFTNPIKDSTNGAYEYNINTAAGSFDNPYVKWDANGYRLPTEGEWQYAASYKDGLDWTPFNYASGAESDYSDNTATGQAAWFDSNSENTVHDDGEKTANALGIYDMSGNVFEWCWDWYGLYPGDSVDYKGPDTGFYHELRGGSYNSAAFVTQVGCRYIFGYPYNAFNHSGLRLARSN